MKRSMPLKRSAPLRRGKPPKAKRATPRRSERVRDPEFLAWVRTQPCALRDFTDAAGPCRGRVEANHLGKRPYGRKADDTTAAPFCQAHHQDWTDGRGFFDARRVSAEARRAYADQVIAFYRMRWDLRQQGVEEVPQ